MAAPGAAVAVDRGDADQGSDPAAIARAYIDSQRHEGWLALDDRYDDGGYSGGTLERPALRRLIREIEAGRVDTVVCYNIDRLSRSLTDFAKLVDVFERSSVTFVSATQSFCTTTSMGRLTLNILHPKGLRLAGMLGNGPLAWEERRLRALSSGGRCRPTRGA